MTNNQPSRTLKASSRTYFFDIKTGTDGGKYLLITASRLKDKQRVQFAIFPEEILPFSRTLGEMAQLIQ